MKPRWLLVSISCVCLGLWAGKADAQQDRDKFIVVKTEELDQNPRRYWSRGIVFEDVLQEVTGRTRRVGGRRLAEVLTEQVGAVYVDPSIRNEITEAEPGQRYLFAGTVVSDSGRNWLLRRVTHYRVVVDTMDRLADDVRSDLKQIFLEGAPEDTAFDYIQRALGLAQNELIAEARSSEVPIQELFEVRQGVSDKVSELVRSAVRDVEQDAGLTSAEILSQLIRELLSAQYRPEPEETAEAAAPDDGGDEDVEADENRLD